ncbi:MAG: iron response transcriptional regulator IrrA [Aquisalimonadaceae bacterium]
MNKTDTALATTSIRNQLRALGLRPTRQRIAVARLLFSGEHRHLSAEELYNEAQAAGIRLAYTTVYNILHQFTQAGLIREVPVESGRTWFDTNIGSHVHLFDEDSGQIRDLELDSRQLELLRELHLPEDVEIRDVDIIVRVRKKKSFDH